MTRGVERNDSFGGHREGVDVEFSDVGLLNDEA